MSALCAPSSIGSARRASCDFVWDVAAPLPLMVIAELLGFDPEAHEDLLRWSDDLMRATTLEPTPEQARAGFNAMMGFREFQLGVIADRRRVEPAMISSPSCAGRKSRVGGWTTSRS